MIFFCDNSGAIFKTVPEKIYQGSVNANVIYFVGAFDQDCVVTAKFTLPNGLYATEQIMSSAYTALPGDIQTENGIKYGVWSLALNSVVTELSGNVQVQFTVTNANVNGVAATICTALSSFPVEKGVPVLQDNSIDNYETLLTQIKAVLTALQQGDTENSIASAASAEAARISAENAAEAEQQALAAQESAQASAESASQSETIVAGAVSQIQSYIKQTEQNTLNITNIQAVLQGNSQYAEIELSEAYTSRFTANGANIFDGQLTPVLSIKGSTVRYNDTLKNANINSIVSTGKNLLSGNPSYQGWVAGAYITTDFESFLKYFVIAPIGTKFTLSADIRCDKVVNNPFDIRLVDTDNNGATRVLYLMNRPTSFPYVGTLATTFTKSYELSEGYSVRMSLGDSDTNSNYMRDIQIQVGDTATEYEPYTTYTYQLSQTVELAEFDIILPPEQTLTRYTETIVFETTSDYWEMISSGIFKYTGDLPETPYITQTGGFCVCNLFDPVSSQNPNGSCGIGVDGYFIVIKQDINSLEDFLSYLQTQETNGNPLMIAYKTAEPVSSVTFAIPQVYEVYKGGTETVVQGKTDNSIYGAKPTITQTYLGKVGE